VRKVTTLIVLFVLFVTATFAYTTDGVAGRWNVIVSAEGHHPPNAVLEMEQKDGKIVGNFMIPNHGDLPVEGNFTAGKLTLRSTEDAFMKMELIGVLKDDGTFSGTVDTEMGLMTWTAKRAE